MENNSKNSSGTIRTREDLSSTSSYGSPQQPTPKALKMADSEVTNETLLAILTEVRINTSSLLEANAQLRQDLDEVKAGLSMQNTLIEELKKDKSVLQTKVKSLESSCATNNIRLRTLENRVQEAEDKTEALEMYTRKNSLEIHGVPESKGEDLDEIVIKVADRVGVEVEEDEIEIVHRLPVKLKGVRPIIAKFKSHKIKSQIYFSRRKLRGTEDEDELNGAKEIYINENLTAYRRKLFAEARKRTKINKWYKTWTTDGKIFITKEKGDRAVKVNNYSELESMYI